MCGRFSVAVNKKDLTEYLEDNYDISVLPETITLPRYNIAPSEDVISLINDGTKYRIGLLKWGFTNNDKFIINARSETIDKLPVFKKSFQEKRCLILADGFFEWKRETGTKEPYRFTLKNKKIFAFAGLWQAKQNKDKNTVYETLIITKKANQLMKDIHDRMPVILTEEEAFIWLDPSLKKEDALKKILNTDNELDLVYYPVSQKVNSSKYKEEDAIREIKKST